MADDQLTQLLQKASPQELQEAHTIIYAAKYGKMGIDPSKLDSAKVDRAWNAVQSVVAGPQPGRAAGLAREFAIGAGTSPMVGEEERVKPVSNQVPQQPQQTREQYRQALRANAAQNLQAGTPEIADVSAGLSVLGDVAKAGYQSGKELVSPSSTPEQRAHGLGGARRGYQYALDGHQGGARPLLYPGDRW